MNILVIGNGFDLAHKLPTSYKDFLGFITYVNSFYNSNVKDIDIYKDAPNFKALNIDIQNYFLKKYALNKDDQFIDELIYLSSDNIWIKYFKKCIEKNKIKGENWIDFESEITKVVKSLEYLKKHNDYNSQLTPGNRKYASNYIMYENGKNFINDVSCKLVEKNILSNKLDYENIVDSKVNYTNLENNFFCKSNSNKIISELNNELNNLIRCLEIYLDYVVRENVKISNKLDDIEKIDKIDKLISFNYSYTFKDIYDVKEETEYDYIHGVADKNKDIEKNNMVLGIDEYLDEKNKNIELDFIQFKKYYQRIYKNTGCKYKKWLEEIEENNHIFSKSILSNTFLNNIYFYGHSLDITDKDILQELIMLPKSQITIFYYSKNDYKQKISNLVRLIGQDYLNSNVYGSNPKIIFKEITK